MFPAKRIKELREIKNLNQSELANTLQIGQSTMSEYENGVKQPPVSVLVKIADYFNVSLDYLSGRTNIKHTVESIQERLETKSENKISINALIRLSPDEKEAIAILIKLFNRSNMISPVTKQNEKISKAAE